MRKIRFGAVVLAMLLCWAVTPVSAQVSIGIGLPNVSIGINIPLYPELVPISGYPVYYAPRLNANFFFYDGLYWVFVDDYWYASYWYNGPWWVVEPYAVPVFILRIPVRYYRAPPPYFQGWRRNAPPRWGQHWGHDWEERRHGWDKWQRGSAPARAPLPAYQRQYSGDRYPRQVEQQEKLRREHYRYQPRDKAVRQHFQQPRGEQRAPAPGQRGRQEEPRMRGPGQQEMQRPAPREHGAPPGQRPQPQHQAPTQQRGPAHQERMEQPRPVPREQQAPRPRMQEPRPQMQEPRPQMQEPRMQERPQEPGRGHGQGPKEERGR